ncbi:MAG TPA: hypothetical protein VM686_28865 [Polyangiaceae bacterium]|nr:hypothetical protein [Polyangiaceae bacterium]
MTKASASTSAPESRSARPDPPDRPAGEAGDALVSAVTGVAATLRGLFAHSTFFDAQAIAEVRRTVEAVEHRLGRDELHVVVVGERHSGKSTLLDAIVGDRLLGGARGQLEVVTFLRRRAAPSFRARFASGEQDDFSRRVPDRTLELARAEDTIEQALADVERRASAARAELGQANEARERAEQGARQALSGAEDARELADDRRSLLDRTEDEAARLDREVGELELRVPQGVRLTPPRWALWSWLLFGLFLLLRRELWSRYQALLAERAVIQVRLIAQRRAADAAKRARLLAEAELEPLGAGFEQARVQSLEVEHGLHDAELERERLRGELEVQRTRREHHESERWRQFFTDLHALARRRDLCELAIDYPAKHLPDDVTIVDIPGMVSESAAEWRVISEQADGCILVSELDRAVSEAAKRFLRQLREVVPHLLLVLTKMDQAFEAASARGEAEPWAEVEKARRIGARRFARELGRDADSVLSVSVAAEVALRARDSELAKRFESEIAKLFLLLRHERALILGAHAAGAIRRCIAGIGSAQERAESTYRDRIAELELKRTPEPATFRKELLLGAEPEIEALAHTAIEAASTVMQEGFLLLQRRAEQDLDACPSVSKLVEVAAVLERELPLGVAQVREQTRVELEAAIERAVSSIEVGLFEAMRRRYQLLHEVRRSASSSPRLDADAGDAAMFTAIVPQVREAVVVFRRGRYALGAAGVLSGAAGGALVHPWLGPALGGVIGGLLGLVRRESSLRERAQNVVRTALAQRQEQYFVGLRGEEAGVREAIRQALERSLTRVMVRFERFIAEPLEAERQAIAAEQQKLAELEQLRSEVRSHDSELERLLKVAANASVGLCR